MLNPENRKLIKGLCTQCNKDILKREIHFKLHKTHFCSPECQFKYKKTGEERACTCCGKTVWKTKSEFARSKTGNIFCSRTCATIVNNKLKVGEKHSQYKDGSSSYREKAIKEYGAKCYKCGYNKFKEVLEVHHKDKNRTNNKLSNLEVLCSNCHKEEHLL